MSVDPLGFYQVLFGLHGTLSEELGQVSLWSHYIAFILRSPFISIKGPPPTSLLFAFLSPRFLAFVFWQLPKNGSIAGKSKKKNLLCLKVSLFYSQILLIDGYQ